MSTDYKKAFSAMRPRQEWKPQHNVAVKVVAFEGKPANIIKGIAMNGPNEGEEIRLRMSKDAHPKAVPVADFHKKNTLFTVEPGAILQADRMTKAKDGVFETGWLSVLSKNPEKNPVHLDVYASVAPLMAYDSASRTRSPVTDSKGVQRFVVRAFSPEQETAVANVDALKSAIAEAAGKPPLPAQEGSRGVVVTLSAPDGASHRFSMTRGFDQESPTRDADGNWLPRKGNPVEDLVSNVIERLGGEEQAAKFLEDGVKIGVAPYAVMPVGGKSAEKLQSDIAENDGRGRSIDTTNLDRTTRDGQSISGYVKAVIQTGSYPDDEGNPTDASFVSRLRRVDSSKPVALIGVDSSILPEAGKIWRAEEQKRLEGQKAGADAAANDGAAASSGKPDAGALENKGADEKKVEATAAHDADYDEAAELDQIMGMVENLPAEKDDRPEV